MARSSSSQQRSLTVMEELEKLEQSITLTLQEIDHNFSRAHRIVTSQILPVIDDYAKHSEELWESSKFWKQFFEASANVSLNSYEETTATEETITETDTTTTDTGGPSTSSYLSTPSKIPGNDPDFATPVSNQTFSTFRGDESPDFDTPQAIPRTGDRPKARTAPSTSTIQRTKGGKITGRSPSTPSTMLSTPLGQTISERDDSTFMQLSTARQQRPGQNGRTPAKDPIMHRVLDKNFRVQATPHSQMKLPMRSVMASTRTPETGRKAPARAQPSALDSSPMMEAPKLNSEIFASPYRAARVPGVSVLSPAKHKAPTSKDGPSSPQLVGDGKSKASTAWDSESDDDDGLPEGYSPPKTMQFHIPQSKLLQTPAKEASRRIVDDLLMTAGGNLTDDSPSVIGRRNPIDDDTF